MVVKSWHPPENGFVFLEQQPKDGVELFTSLGIYCSVCYSVSKDLGVFSRSQDPEMKQEVFIRWEVQLAELASSADEGCQFCSFMACRFFDDPMFTFMFHNSSSETIIACCGSALPSEKTDRVITAVKNIKDFVVEHPSAQITVIAQPSDQLPDDLKYGKVRFTAAFTNLDFEATRKIMGVRTELILELYAVEDNPAANFIKTRPININPASDESTEWARTWIEKCLHNHSECPGPRISKLPTRVIKILDDENLILVENEGSGAYTTLSYVWGGPQTFALRSDTIDQNLKGFKISDLPQTLQDGVMVTKKLGQEYIWIDALCIIQDSEIDRDIEIPKMPQYYQNSYVTISAGLAGKATTGFLKIRDECENHPGSGLAKDLLHLPYLCPNGEVGEVLFREESNYCLSQEPVSCRAWTLQERILSPRVLIYGSRLLWQCNACQHSNGGVEDWSFDLRASDHRRIQLQFVEISKPESKDHEEGKLVEQGARTSRNPYDVWYRTIHEYSYLNLTLPEDKLPAISGLAIEFAKLSGDEYLAGLWRSQLLRELMWSTYPDLQLSRPSVWRAPSWSWASVDNQISFEQLSPESGIEMAEVINCGVTPRSRISPFGEITDATLKIRGPLLDFGKDQPGAVAAIASILKYEHQAPPLRDEDKGLEFRRMMINVIFPRQGETQSEWVQPEVMSLLVMFARPKEHEEVKATHTQDESDQEERGQEKTVQQEKTEDTNNQTQDVGDETLNTGDEENDSKEEKENMNDQIKKEEDEKSENKDEARELAHRTKDNKDETSEEPKDITNAKEESSNPQTTPKLHATPEATTQTSTLAPDPANPLSLTSAEPMQFQDDAALLSCLVLVKQPDGRYERIASLMSLSFKGVSMLKSHVKEVEIV